MSDEAYNGISHAKLTARMAEEPVFRCVNGMQHRRKWCSDRVVAVRLAAFG